MLVGGLVLVGWRFDSEALKRILPGLVAMNPASALAFILAGAALGVLADEHADPRARRLAQVGAALVALIGLFKLVAVGGGPDLGLDRLLFATKLAADPTHLPNRMAPNTALNFLLVGSALLLLDRRTHRGYWPGQAAIALAGVASLLPALGYAYGLRSFYGIGAFIPMALHTALTFLVLVVGLLCARPGRGLVAIVASASAGGVMARRLLPAVLLLPAALGWLVLHGQRRGLYDSALGVALFAVTAMLGLALVVGWNARLLHQADAARGQIEAELARQATHDALTGLPNRALFTDRLGQALARASRRQVTLAVLFLDLDGFKAVNDSLGHAAGDQLLVAVADRMRACLRLEDTVARLGGDEFTMLLEGLTDLRGATLVAERITRGLAAPFTLAGHAVVVTSSIGIALNDPHRGEQRADELLRAADVAMYRAKAAGKACHAVFAAGTDAGVDSRLDHETDPRCAVLGRPQPRLALGQPPAPPVPLI